MASVLNTAGQYFIFMDIGIGRNEQICWFNSVNKDLPK